MERRKPVIGFIAIVLGAGALLLAIVHLWAGPFSPQPKIETTVAEKAVAIRDATIAALKGEKSAPPRQVEATSRMNLDRLARLGTGTGAGLAMVLAVVSLALHEPVRVAAGGLILGGAALAFQFAILAIGAVFLALLVAAVVGELDFG